MKRLFTIGYYATIGGIGLIGLMFVATLVPIPGNYKVKVVKSGSMEPAIRVGGIVVIKPASSYEIGDVITFGADTKTQIPTTHRIVAVEGEGASKLFQTKGDANDSADPVATRPADISGKMVFTVPYVGYVLAFARTQLGFFLLVGLPAFLVIVEELFAIGREIKRMRARRRKKNVFVEQSAPVIEPEETRRMGDGIRFQTAGQRRPSSHYIVGGVVGALLLGGALLPNQSGDTVAEYSDVEMTQGNLLQAGADFDALRIQISQSTPALILGAFTTLDETPAEPPAETLDEPPSEPPVDEPVVEVSEPVVEITEPEPAPEETPEVIAEETPAETPVEPPAEAVPEVPAEIPAE